jgi:hypothetical protein
VDTERSVSCTKRASHPANKKPKPSSRLAGAAFGLISRELLKPNAIADHRDYFERRKMRLDD